MNGASTGPAACRSELEAALGLLLERVADPASSSEALERAAARCSTSFDRWVRLDGGVGAERLDISRRMGLVLRVAQAELERTEARIARATAVQRALSGRSVASDEPQRCDHQA